jgi:cysteinyl-tRNA synthetase
MEFRGYEVKHVMNFTDVDDKIIIRAREKGVDPFALGEMYIHEFEKHLEDFNILPATVNPRATREMDQIQKMIQGLVDKGFAYAVDGDVYFRYKRIRAMETFRTQG